MEEVHQGVYDPHMNGRMLAKKILRIGYYWTTMEIDGNRLCELYEELLELPNTCKFEPCTT